MRENLLAIWEVNEKKEEGKGRCETRDRKTDERIEMKEGFDGGAYLGLSICAEAKKKT